MYKVGEVAKLFGVNDQTLRVWCKQFADYLSPGATPGKGATRDFNDDDLKVFRYVQYALSRGHSYDEVWSQLRDGNALKSFGEVFEGNPPTTAETGQGGAIVNANDLLEQYAVTMGRLGEVAQERDYLRGALEQEITAHGATKERAATAEERARLLEASKQLPPPLPSEPQSVKVWRWVLVVGVVAIVALLIVLAVQGVG
jgi:DNA-binding transcriptional MerR regulator